MFRLDDYDERRSLRDFRFLTSDIRGRIVGFFGWEKVRTTRSRYKCDSILATCVVLKRLASPARWEDLAEEFGRYPGMLSEIFWESLEGMIKLWGHLILNWRSDLMTARAAMYVAHIHERAPLDNCLGYLDCTK